jgi:hypothetical protein
MTTRGTRWRATGPTRSRCSSPSPRWPGLRWQGPCSRTAPSTPRRPPAGAAHAVRAGGLSSSGASPLLRTIVVSPSGTGTAADGALLAAAVAGISGADATTPYLVSLEPGVYDLGSTPLHLPANVDLEGSGQDVTTISGEGQLVLGTAPGTEVRELTVSDADATGPAEAIDASGGLRDVTAVASGTSAATAVLAASPTMPIVDVTASATTSSPSSFVQAIDAQGAVTIDGGSFTATDGGALGQAAALFAEGPAAASDTTLRASGGANPYPVDVVASTTTVTVTGSRLIGSGGFFVSAGDTLGVGASEIPGVPTSGSGTTRCPGDWLASYATASTDCS